MSMLPFNFAVHRTSESFLGNGSTRIFSFTQIPAITKTDIQVLIYNTINKTETIIDYADFDFVLNSTYVGFTITLGDNIETPSSSETLIAKLSRVVKNDAVFPDGSTPSPREITIGYQALTLSMATLLLNAQQSGLSFPISDVLNNINALTLPQIDTNLSKFNIGLRKRDDGKYELYYSTEFLSVYNVDVKEIEDNYTLKDFDNIILYKAGSPDAKKVILYKHLNIQEGYARYIEIRNESAFDLKVEYDNVEIDTVPTLTTCLYKIDSSATYSIV
jgi:hypothetical protein